MQWYETPTRYEHIIRPAKTGFVCTHAVRALFFSLAISFDGDSSRLSPLLQGPTEEKESFS
jgi:hypothetical protein